jgi:hypothetical protein
VADAAMTLHALHRIRIGCAAGRQIVHELAVTPQTILLENSRVSRGDLDRLVEVLEREGLGVPPAVVRLGDHLGDQVVRQMALDARRGVVVRPFCHESNWSRMM